MSNNKKRLLSLLEILKRESDEEHTLSISDLIALLEAEGIRISDRKTLYDDIAVLSSFGYEVDTQHGYSLSAAPFSLSEVKILLDSVSSLKNLDPSFEGKIMEKLYSFLSVYEEDFLKELSYENVHTGKHLIRRMEDTLHAIKEKRSLFVIRKQKEEEIFPLFLHRNNDYYYLYYHYPNNPKIYHFRYDNILDIRYGDKKDTLSISKEDVMETIRSSTQSFYSSKARTVKIEILNDSESLRQRLQDDFPTVLFSKKGFSVKVSVNHLFFSKILAYGSDIKISDPEAADQYETYLRDILKLYH